MQSRKPLVVALLALGSAAVLLCAEAGAQLARRGGEFQINSSPVGGGHVAPLPGGGFLVVWDSDGADGDGLGVLGRRFDAESRPVGTEFVVNATTTGHQGGPRVAAARDGSFFVFWNTTVGRAFSAQAEPAGSEVDIAEPEMSGPATSVAVTEAGEFVVAFSVYGTEYSIRARRFGSYGQPLGDPATPPWWYG